MHPHSSYALFNFKDTLGASDPKLGKIRTDFGMTPICDNSLEYAKPPMRRSSSFMKKQAIDLGRSPHMPFVHNLRTTLKRNSS